MQTTAATDRLAPRTSQPGAGNPAGSAPDYQALVFADRAHPDETAETPARHPVVIVGAGPVGMTLAIDLARQGRKVLLLDDDDRLSNGSRAICFAKRTLEIWDRLGCGEPMVEKGVSWNLGKVYFHDEAVYAFDLLGQTGHHRPAFVNLQQYYAEGYLSEALARHSSIEVRWKNRVVDVRSDPGGADLEIETPRGRHWLRADWLIACDGSRSPVRKALGLESKGRSFRDRFLIADVKMKASFPPERWFWFDPPFHPNQSVLLHRQPDDVWRIDFQLGWDTDPDEEKKPEKVRPRIQALLGPDAEFEFEWISVYSFACLRMDHFVHGRVVFAGDSAHGVSPFGARGANSGVQDADNLGWKLGLVLNGQADDALIGTYGSEREWAADENIRNSTRATDFITPKSEASRTFRDAVLRLSREHPFARTLVNSGRLSVPAVFDGSPLNTADVDAFDAPGARPGASCADAPVRVDGEPRWFLDLLGDTFRCVVFADAATCGETMRRVSEQLATLPLPVGLLVVCEAPTTRPTPNLVIDAEGVLSTRLDARLGTTYLFRPDQHVCARWRQFDTDALIEALACASGQRLARDESAREVV